MIGDAPATVKGERSFTVRKLGPVVLLVLILVANSLQHLPS